MKLITTSWDDGYTSDFKLADLLRKYNLPGTFYIPKFNAEREVLSASEIIALSEDFEIGGHTLNHSRLNNRNQLFIEYEVKGSYAWLKDLLGYEPVSFCFPGGKFDDTAVTAVFKTGYKLARTSELLSTRSSLRLVPTTIQMYEHSSFTYIKHLVKRRRSLSLVEWLTSYSYSNLEKLVEAYINKIYENGGCFHLWGHSWEIDEYELWIKLEKILRIISNLPEFSYVQNKELVNFQ